MKKHYKQLTLKEREKIDVLRRTGTRLSSIAQQLGVNKSTISRELRRNKSAEYNCYVASRAHVRSAVRKRIANRHDRLKDPRVLAYVRYRILENDWSPEIIAARIKHDLPGIHISHEAIYQYIYSLRLPDRLELVEHLARRHRKRKIKCAGRGVRKTKIPNRVSIEQRPAIVAVNTQPGHWEADSLISRASSVALNSLTERVTRLLFITKLAKRGSSETARAIINRLEALPSHLRQTLTLDNGTENAEHERITRAIGTKCFFAHPYCAYERGANEQINGLIRRYLPKGTDFATIAKDQIRLIQEKINNRPRKCLGFLTPIETASKLNVALQY